MSIQTPVVEGFCNTTEMRLKVLHTHLQTIKDKGESYVHVVYYQLLTLSRDEGRGGFKTVIAGHYIRAGYCESYSSTVLVRKTASQ